ncbi:hypothetical protein [Paenibacillus sp. 7523-1]|nr:hypothetical protein [Paenibacillus sp. 7523-1]
MMINIRDRESNQNHAKQRAGVGGSRYDMTCVNRTREMVIRSDALWE